MVITETYRARNRDDWRSWLQQQHRVSTEIWLLYDDRAEVSSLTYLDSVEEAICFGWIDGIQKRVSDHEMARRFTPRGKRSRWTELNKARARRLLRLGMMSESGVQSLPALDAPFHIPEDIIKAIKAEPDAWSCFSEFPDLYIRVRVGYIEEMRKNREAFEERLNNFVRKTAAGKRIGNWDDDGRLP